MLLRVRVCVCGVWLAILNATRWTIPPHTCSEIRKRPRSTAAVQQQQQWHNTTEARIAHIHTIGTLVFLFFNLRHPWDFKSNHMSKVNLVAGTG